MFTKHEQLKLMNIMKNLKTDQIHFLDEYIYPAQHKAYKINKNHKLCEEISTFEGFKKKALVNEWLFNDDTLEIL